ncbi:hypothetical protein GKZ28_13215 [Clostridium chromiireducens]|uniref:Phage tail protein n=2 Tax=Clostridium chromiireducens TaxID=225345 RepID=A0A964RN40_9CLOT|nr:hypothetical protein [Clostridium chromiireducens]
MPQMNFITDKNDLRDGEIFIDAHYGVREIEMTVLFDETGADLFELKKWLGKKHQQIFNWDDDWDEKAIFAIENGNWKSQVYYGKPFYGRINLKFICHNPYYFKLKDRDITFANMVLNQDYAVKSKGNSDSLPLIKITPNTTKVVFKWNDLTITLNNLTINNPIYLDCEKCQCYEMSNNIKTFTISKFTSNYAYEFPILLCDARNTLKVIEGSASFVISPCTRII